MGNGVATAKDTNHKVTHDSDDDDDDESQMKEVPISSDNKLVSGKTILSPISTTSKNKGKDGRKGSLGGLFAPINPTSPTSMAPPVVQIVENATTSDIVKMSEDILNKDEKDIDMDKMNSTLIKNPTIFTTNKNDSMNKNDSNVLDNDKNPEVDPIILSRQEAFEFFRDMDTQKKGYLKAIDITLIVMQWVSSFKIGIDDDQHYEISQRLIEEASTASLEGRKGLRFDELLQLFEQEVAKKSGIAIKFELQNQRKYHDETLCIKSPVASRHRGAVFGR